MNTKTLLSILALIAVVLAGGGYLYTNSGKAQEASIAASVPAETSAPATEKNPTPSESVPASTSAYKDGIYSAEGSYRAPSGMEAIKVSLTLKKGTITEADVSGVNAKNPETRAKQAEFIAGYKAMVIGKSIDEANLTKVSGSSLTPLGWNAALEKIKAEAKA